MGNTKGVTWRKPEKMAASEREKMRGVTKGSKLRFLAGKDKENSLGALQARRIMFMAYQGAMHNA